MVHIYKGKLEETALLFTSISIPQYLGLGSGAEDILYTDTLSTNLEYMGEKGRWGS
jgi:hypothetical protein